MKPSVDKSQLGVSGKTRVATRSQRRKVGGMHHLVFKACRVAARYFFTDIMHEADGRPLLSFVRRKEIMRIGTEEFRNWSQRLARSRRFQVRGGLDDPLKGEAAVR